MKKKHIALLLCFLWMAVIFLFSNQEAQQSQGLSNSCIEVIENFFHIDILTQGGWLADTLSFLIRKAAHMSEYAILAILYVGVMRAFGCSHPWGYAIALTFSYACTDEFHQLFIRGRSGQMLDVLIDTTGGILGLAFVWCIQKVRKILRKQN